MEYKSMYSDDFRLRGMGNRETGEVGKAGNQDSSRWNQWQSMTINTVTKAIWQ